MNELKFRVFASDSIFPNGKMYCPGTLSEIDANRGFAINQFGDLIHTTYIGGESRSLNNMIWARIGFNVDSVMRFTGLKDKLGKDIYEGDICKFDISGDGEKYNPLQSLLVVVEWKNASWGFRHIFPELVIEEDRKWTSFWRDYDEEFWDTSYFEVIGNVFENKELMVNK